MHATAGNVAFQPRIATLATLRATNGPQPLLEELLTVREVAAQLKVSPALVYRLVARGQLAHVRIAGALRFTCGQLQSYLRSRVT